MSAMWPSPPHCLLNFQYVSLSYLLHARLISPVHAGPVSTRPLHPMWPRSRNTHGR
ncbi:hypothetical protein ARTHRO9AX_10210 [Arthrobacter sp. 9AX]|nr:hypothetical protein ARTHRO9AX_10210 [Arthrobacter sp. 9AX]